MAMVKIYPKMAKNGNFSSDVMLKLRLIKREFNVPAFSKPGFTWVHNKFHIPFICSDDMVTMVTKAIFTETSQITVWAHMLNSIFTFLQY